PHRSCSFLLCFLFFFYSCLHLLYLHSFPTRRSSDLAFWGVSMTGMVPNQDMVGNIKASRLTPRTTNSVIVSIHKCQSSRSTTSQDRKSTRLNSSHVAISYAVFCLKKKKKK